MGAVHTFVTEVLRELVNTFESAHDKAFQIKFVGNTEVERNVERIVVSDERTRRSTARDRLENRSLHFHVAVGVEILTHGVVHLCALDEYVFYTVVHHQVNVALAVAEFRVFECVVGYTVLHLYDRQRTQRLAEHLDALGMYGDFAHLGSEHKTFDAHKVADIEQFFEEHIVEVLVFIRAKVVTTNVNLDSAFCILKFHERSLSHDASAHDTSRDAHITHLGVVLKVFFDFFGVAGYNEFGSRIRLDSHFTQLGKTVTTNNLLFTQLKYIHILLLVICNPIPSSALYASICKINHKSAKSSISADKLCLCCYL